MSNGKLSMIARPAVGAVCVGLAVVDFAKTANDLPSLLPGNDSSVPKKHAKHGIAMLGLALVAFLGAWMLSPPARNHG